MLHDALPISCNIVNPQMIFHNGLLRSLLSQIQNIWQQPTWPATTRSTSGAPLAILVRVHWDFTVSMATKNKNKQGKKPSVPFSNTSTNEVIYFSYLMTNSEDSTEEEPKGGDDNQSNYFISLSHFELLGWLLKRVFSPLLLYFYYSIT